MKYKLAVGIFAIASTLWGASEALAATRIQFARGSYCGSYSGNFQSGRDFVLNLGRGQTFTVRNIGEGSQYNVSVFDSMGQLYGRKVSREQINYQIAAGGDYYVYIQADVPYSNVEFCAY